MSLLLVATLVSATSAAEPAKAAPAFRIHELRSDSEFSACAIFDVNRDGRTDIFCGDTWFAGPDWKRHHVRDVEQIRGRFDDYSNQPLDVNGDGWIDVISINYRSSSLYWVENPGQRGGEWEKHVIAVPGSSETGRLVDLNGDGKLDILPNGTKFAAWWELVGSEDPPQWKKHDLPQQLAGHGIGAGDIDGDGRVDLVNPQGWFRAILNDTRIAWQWQPGLRLHRDAGLPILVHDVDGDGDSDVIWGRGHNVGLYWVEQSQGPDEQPIWTRRAIDTSWSCCHSLLLGDLDGDGREELVVGKRFLGHDGKDPGETDPLLIASYSFDRERRSWNRNLISVGGAVGMDLDPALGDVDNDGDLDIVCPARSGLYLCENLGSNESKPPATTLAPAFRIPDSNQLHTDLKTVRLEKDSKPKPIENTLDWGNRRWQILAGMEQAMGPLPGPSERVPLQAKVVSEEREPSYTRRKVTFVADSAGDRVSAYILIPHNIEEPRPAMLCLHPTSRHGKDLVAGTAVGNDVRPNRNYGHELAERGYVCLIPDYPSFGEYEYDFAAHRPQYVSGSMKAIWNNIRSVDLLETMAEVDADRIGCIGHSLGGHNSLFSAVFDLRLRVVATSCGFTEFHQYYEGRLKGWTSDRYMPRIRDEYGNDPDRVPFDFQEVIASLAPRGVFISAPVDDSNFEIAGVKVVVEEARPVYELFKKRDHLVAVYPDCAHDFPEPVRKQCYQAIDKWFGFRPAVESMP